MKNNVFIITVDVETDWGGRLPVSEGNCKGIENCLPVILDMFNEFEIKGTFFISGVLLEKWPDMVKKISRQGHEIASHGYEHQISYNRISLKLLKEQIGKSKEELEGVIGEEVQGFRTPQFRITNSVFPILEETGFKYDSSVVKSIFPGRYRNLKSNQRSFKINNIIEFPVSSFPLIRIPFGLLWLNAIGLGIYKKLCHIFPPQKILVFYLHPFDLLPAKGAGDFPFFVRSWYRHKCCDAVNTFRGLIEFHKGQDSVFKPLRVLLPLLYP